MSEKEKELEELINEAETGKDVAAKKIYESFITNIEMDKDLRIKARDYFLKKTENLEECKPNISYYCGCMLNNLNLSDIGNDINHDSAIKCFNSSSEKGNRNATCEYACMLMYGIGIEKDETKAEKLFKKAQTNKSMFELYKIYKERNNPEEIREKYDKLARSAGDGDKYPNAIYELANLNLNGSEDGNIEKNEKKASGLFKDLVDLKMNNKVIDNDIYESSLNKLIDLSLTNYGFLKPEEEVKYYKAAADIGNIEAKYKLAKCYKNGIGVEKDEGKANNFLKDVPNDIKQQIDKLDEKKEEIRKENEKKENYKKTISEKVKKSIENDLILSNPQEEIKLYKEAAELGNLYAAYKLNECYRYGIGVEKDGKKAQYFNDFIENKDREIINRYFRELEKEKVINLENKKNTSPDKMTSMELLKLAINHEHGIGDAKFSKEEAFELYKKSMKKDNIEAMYSVARCYENGIGTKQDLTKAKNLYKKAADKGNIEAMYNVARCYEKRIGTKNKFGQEYYKDKALKYYKKAADLNHAEAAFKVAESYFKIDKKEAIKYYKIAANQDHAEAAFTLGQFYEFGDPTRETGINVNLKEAAKYYKIAADQGNEIAQKHLAELNQKLNEQSKIKPITKTADPSKSITNITTESKKPKESKGQEDNKLAPKTPNKSNIKVEQNSVEIVERSVDIETNPTVKNPDKTTINNKGDKEVKTSLNSPEKRNSLTESTDPSAILRSINDKLIKISDESLKNIAKEIDKLKKPEEPKEEENKLAKSSESVKDSFNELKNKMAEKLGTNTRNFKEHKNLTEEQLKEAEERNKNNDGVKWTEHTENSNRWYKSNDESWKEKENIGDDPIKRKENRDKTMRQIREENGQDIDNEPGPENLSFSQKVNIINNGGKIPEKEIKQENNLSTEPEEKTTVTDLNTSSSSVNTESSDNSDTLTSKDKNDTPTNTEPTKSSINNEKLSEAAEAAKILNNIGIKKDNGEDFTEDDMMPDKIEESIRPILEGFNENFNEYEKNGGNPKISNYNMYKDSVMLFNKKNNVKVIKNDETGAIKEIRIKDPDNEAKTEIIDFEQNYDSLSGSRSRIGYITTFSNQSVKNNPLNTAEGIKELKEYMDKNSINKNIKVNKEVNEPEPIQPKPEPKEELEDKEQKEKDDFRVEFFNSINNVIKKGTGTAKTLEYNKEDRAEFYNENGEKVELENIQSGELLKQTVGNLNNFLHNENFLFNKTQRDQEINFEELKDYVNNVSVIINNINEVNKNEIKFNEIKNKVNSYKEDFKEDFEKKYETVTAAAVDENTYNNINTNEEIEKEKEELNKRKDELKQKYEEYKKQIDEKSDEISNKEKESENIVKDCEEFTSDNVSPFNSNGDTTKLNDKFKNLNNSLQIEDLNINLEGLKIEMTELKVKQEALSKQEEKIKTQQQFSFKDNNPKSNLDKQVMAIAADTVNINENDLLSKNDDLENQCEKIFGERNIEAEGEKNTRKHKELQKSINKLDDNQKINYAKRMEDLIGYSLDHPDKKIDIDYCEKQRLYLIKCKNNKKIDKISRAGIGNSITELSENYRKTIGEKSLGLESKVEDIKPEDFYPKGTKINKEEQEKYNFTKFTVENIAEDEEDKFKNYSINLKYSKNVNTVDLMAYIRENGFEAAKEKYKDQGLDFVIRDKNGKEVGEKEKKEMLEKLQPKDKDKLMEIKKNKEQKKNNSLSPEGQQVQQTLDKNGLHKNSVTSTGQDISINNVKSNAISSGQQTKKAGLNK